MNLQKNYNTNCIYQTGDTATITVAVDLTLPNVVKDRISDTDFPLNENKKPKPSEWGWSCSIDKQEEKLVCTAEHTESGSKEIPFKPEFKKQYIGAYLKIETITGGGDLGLWFSDKIGGCEKKTVVWVDEDSLEFKCSGFGDGDESNYVCCYNQ